MNNNAKKSLVALFAFSCLVFTVIFSGCSSEKKPLLENIAQISNNADSPLKYNCTFNGTKHVFIIDFPDGKASGEGCPLVVMLHGYGRSPESFREDSHFEKLANEKGYVVVYASGTGGGWNSGLGLDNIKDVDYIIALTEYLQKEYKLDKKHTYAVGFSNGAFMTHRLAMEAPKTFSACVSVAGKLPEKIWEKRNKKNKVSVFQISGEKDSVVPKLLDGSAKTAKDPAIEDVMEYWAVTNGLDSKTEEMVGKGSVLTKYTKAGKQNQVWHLLVKDGRHDWPSVEHNGINMNEMIIDFFESVK